MISDLWEDAEKQVQASMQVLRSTTQAEASFFVTSTQPRVEEEKKLANSAESWKRRGWGEEQVQDAKRPTASKEEAPLEPAEAEAEPSKALVPVARFGNETPRTPNTIPATLAQSSPYDTAKEYVRRHCFHEGDLTTYFWQNEYWEWNGRHYTTVEPEIIRDRVYAFLDGSRKFVGGDELTRFKPTSKLVNDVLDALKAGLTLRNTCQPPMWFGSGEPATDVLVFRNGLVNVLTGELSALTPKLWVHSAVGYDYDPKAKCPMWERFLEQVFPGDKKSQTVLKSNLAMG